MLNAATNKRQSLSGEERQLATPTSKTRTLDEQILYVVGHEIRIEALAILCERVSSPNEIALETGQDLSQVSYHVKELERANAVELIETKPVRGTVEHFYRATLRPNIPDEEWAALSEETRYELTALVFQAIVAEGLGAIRARTFDSRLNRHLGWRVVRVDEEGFSELVAHEAEGLDVADRAEARSSERLQKADEAGFSVILASMVYERARPTLASPEALRLRCGWIKKLDGSDER